MRLPFRIPSADCSAFDIVGFGQNSVDLLTVVAEHPTPNTKQRVQRFARLPGGQIATALATCARLGYRARYVGSWARCAYSGAVVAVGRNALRSGQCCASSGRFLPSIRSV